MNAEAAATSRSATRRSGNHVAAPREVEVMRRRAFWALLGAKLVAGWGLTWDFRWHVLVGRDSFWIPPHLLIYGGVALVVLLSFGVLASETVGPQRPGAIWFGGLRGSRGFHLAAWGVAITVLAAPLDDVWHRLFGLDVDIWSPPHLIGLLGVGINTIGCLLIAHEIYPIGSRAHLLAVVAAGGFLYGGLTFAVKPAMRIAYLAGGIWFYTHAVLAALLLPIALSLMGQLSGHRGAPILLPLVALLGTLLSDHVSRTGFALLRVPPSFLVDTINAHPTSLVAVTRAIAQANGTSPGSPDVRAGLLGILPAIVLAAVDVRRRPVPAAGAFGLVLFAVSAWHQAHQPAFASSVPSAAATGAAALLAVAAGLLGGLASCRFASALAEAGAAARTMSDDHVASRGDGS